MQERRKSGQGAAVVSSTRHFGDVLQRLLLGHRWAAGLRNRDNLGRLLKDKYTGGGKSWNQWECRVLSTTEKRQLLARLSSQPEPLAVAEPALLPSMGIPDFGRVTIGAAGEQRGPLKMRSQQRMGVWR